MARRDYEAEKFLLLTRKRGHGERGSSGLMVRLILRITLPLAPGVAILLGLLY